MNQSQRSVICCPLVLALWVLTPAGARAGWIPEGKILGSVEVPALHQLLNVGEPPAAPGPVRLRHPAFSPEGSLTIWTYSRGC